MITGVIMDFTNFITIGFCPYPTSRYISKKFDTLNVLCKKNNRLVLIIRTQGVFTPKQSSFYSKIECDYVFF
jgi:hypothetical protein